jgi:hypothetical protein
VSWCSWWKRAHAEVNTRELSRSSERAAAFECRWEEASRMEDCVSTASGDHLENSTPSEGSRDSVNQERETNPVADRRVPSFPLPSAERMGRQCCPNFALLLIPSPGLTSAPRQWRLDYSQPNQ